MSWWDTKQLTNLASKAMKEAQKTLDKALDITEEENSQEGSSAPQDDTSGSKWTSSWVGRHIIPKSESDGSIKEKEGQPSSTIAKSISGGASMWGSFSGSFFDASTVQNNEKGEAVASGNQPQNSNIKDGVSTVLTQPKAVTAEPVSAQPRAMTAAESYAASQSVLLNGNRSAGSSNHPRNGGSATSNSSEVLSVMTKSSIMEEEDLSDFAQELAVSTSREDRTCRLSESPSMDAEDADYAFQTSKLVVSGSYHSGPDNADWEDKPHLSGEEMEGSSEDGSTSSKRISSAEVISPSIELISPSSIEIISPSSIEVLSESSPASDDHGTGPMSAPSTSERPTAGVLHGLVTTVDDLESSVSSDRTVTVDQPSLDEVEDQDLQLQDQHRQALDLAKEKRIETMLSDAMVDPENKKSSETSSQSSDIVKLDHQSGDELDTYTTNSSDVEVIASPGACTNRNVSMSTRPNSSSSEASYDPSRQQGHSRSVSGQSLPDVDMDKVKELQRLLDNHREEMAELRKKNSDLNELLHARETRILAVSREISQVQEESGLMAIRLEQALKEADNERSTAEIVRGEFEKLNQEKEQDKRKNADFEKQLARLKKQLESQSGEDQEKDEIIADLRLEGETLAKQNGKQAETIRKLRAKEAESEKEWKKVKSELEKLQEETEKQKKQLQTKTEMETSLNQTVKSLTDANQAWESENKKLRSELDDSQERVTGLRSSLEGAYREMAEIKRNLDEAKDEATAAALDKESEGRREAEKRLESERALWEGERMELEARISHLQSSLSVSEKAGEEREKMARREVDIIRARLEASEARNEDLAESISQASRPLLRQVESLQMALKESQEASERIEHSLTERLRQTSASLSSAQERERNAAEQYRIASAKLASLEGQSSRSLTERKELEVRLEEQERDLARREGQLRTDLQSKEILVQSLKEEVGELKRAKDMLTASLEAEKAEADSRQKKSLALMEQLKERDRRVRELQAEMESRQTTQHSVQPSPTPSHMSLSGSDIFNHRDGWSDDAMRVSTPLPTLYDSIKHGNTTAVMENLHAQLKMREGEVNQLQYQIGQMERLRDSMTSELASLSQKADQADEYSQQIQDLRAELTQLQQKYQTMLTMYGEKVEEAEELRLDLIDVKEMYKSQINELMAQNQSAAGYADRQ